ncbi:hypothetical protein AB433_13630 [Croceicoccus naphthovorans]|uniref:Deacetylase PdaC domain-containing protein n=1 Tax=Croceicoccus naphthovorans TaxID=1348774 RepID=A0A0G3XMI8_9SPHN|nr:hypothetical protein AB433_13630 [Croceicoccus naphthovorans]
MEDGDAQFIFKYTWPAKASAIPELRPWLDADRADRYASAKADWESTVEWCPDGAVSCLNAALQKDWKVVTDLPRFLSLSAEVYTYTGGAHGGTVFDAIVWDRAQGRAVKPIDMFVSNEAVDQATTTAFCNELDKARQRKRGGPIKRSDAWSYDCIAPVASSTVILGSSGGERFDKIGFLIPPYKAGSYAEGAYEVTLPITPALMDAVRPEYRRAFIVP